MPAPCVLREDSRLGRHLRVLLLAKGLHEDAVAARRRERLRRSAAGETDVLRSLFDAGWTVEPAPYLHGAVVLADLAGETLAAEAHVGGVHAPEPFDAAFHGPTLAVAMADHVVLCDAAEAVPRILRHPWFVQLHSLCFSDDGGRLLVTAGDLDSILEIDVASGEVLWRWTSWEHGYAVGADGTYIARTAAEMATQAGRRRAILFGALDEGRFRRGLATGTQPVHVNSAAYSRRGQVLATLFHTGELLEIDPRTGMQRVVLAGLREPHAVARIPGGYCVTDTRRGRWLRLDESLALVDDVGFGELPGKDPVFGALEWIQTACPLGDELYAAVDCLRERVHLFDVRARTYRSIAVPPGLVLQAVRPALVPEAVRLLLGCYGRPTSSGDFGDTGVVRCR